MKINLKKEFDNLVLKKPENFVIIFFHRGMAGSVLLRILIAHKEFHHSLKDLGQSEYDDPLKYPDSIEGFFYQNLHYLPFKAQHLACAHLDFYNPWNSEEDYLRYFNLVRKNKKIAIMTHRFDLYEKFKKCKCLSIIANQPLNRDLISKDIINPKFSSETFTVNINNLLSKNYDKFLDEYIKIVNEFNLTPIVNSVRSFILMWIERQERFNKNLS